MCIRSEWETSCCLVRPTKMATGGSQAQLTELTCTVCFEHYRLPKVLPCSHVYCHLCLHSMAATDAGFNCPMCRQKVNITEQQVDALPTDLNLGSSKETLLGTLHSAMKDNSDIKMKSQISTQGAASSVVMKRKSLPQEMYTEIAFSENPKTELNSLTLSAENKLWVRYQPPGILISLLSVYDCGGKLLGQYVEESVKGPSLTCLGDVLLSPLTWRWIDPDGHSGNYDLPPNDWALCSKSLPPHILLRVSVSESSDKKATFSVHRLQQLSEDHQKVTMCPVITQGLAFDEEPKAFDISDDGRWLAVMVKDKIEVYYTNRTAAGLLSRASPKQDAVDIAFTTLDTKPVLVASFSKIVFIYNFLDGFVTLKCVHYNFWNANSCSCLAAHNSSVVWYAPSKGDICMVDLTRRTLCDTCEKNNIP